MPRIMIPKARRKKETSSQEEEGTIVPPPSRTRRTSLTRLTLHFLMVVNLIFFFTSCFFLNRIFTIGLMDKREDFEAPSHVRQECDADCSKTQHGIEPRPIAEKRADLQPPPVLRKRHDKDYYQNQHGKDYLPLAWLMSFPVSILSTHIIFCTMFVLSS